MVSRSKEAHRAEIYEVTKLILEGLEHKGIFPHKTKVQARLTDLGYKVNASALSGSFPWARSLSDMIDQAQEKALRDGINPGHGRIPSSIYSRPIKKRDSDYQDCWRHGDKLWRLRAISKNCHLLCDRTEQVATHELQRKRRGSDWQHVYWLSDEGVRQFIERRKQSAA